MSWAKHFEENGFAVVENVFTEAELAEMKSEIGRIIDDVNLSEHPKSVFSTYDEDKAERMLADFDHVCGNIGLQLNLTKTMFMRNGYVSDAPFSLNGTNISECSSCVYLGREVNMTNDLSPE
ncbi:unnamed protein product, partial [Nippostrongylus brasiliensis]|uniref:Site-specific DNA-methyltransferase (adenine-specific) n=1 Tax=Nippostrongylus brasiliensis TaxID=27835 RepID=A0A0N4XIN3_NIPBR